MLTSWMFYVIILVPIVWVLWLWLGKRKVRIHRIAILTTAIPPSLLAIVTVVFGLLSLPYSPVAESCLIISLSLVGIALLSSITFAIMRKWEIAKGIGFGSGIGVVIFLIAFVALSS